MKRRGVRNRSKAAVVGGSKDAKVAVLFWRGSGVSARSAPAGAETAAVQLRRRRRRMEDRRSSLSQSASSWRATVLADIGRYDVDLKQKKKREHSCLTPSMRGTLCAGKSRIFSLRLPGFVLPHKFVLGCSILAEPERRLPVRRSWPGRPIE